MTSILLAVAARYVASTSHLFFPGMGVASAAADSDGQRCNNGTSRVDTTTGFSGGCRHRRTKLGYPAALVTGPRVVILDVEKGVHAVKLILSVREAVLRRWEETALARRWKRKHDEMWELDEAEARQRGTTEYDDDDDDGEKFNNTMIEQRQIEFAISSCLARINIVQPRDFTYLGLVATAEALRHSLDKVAAAKESTTGSGASRYSSSQQFEVRGGDIKPPPRINDAGRPQEAPTLILIDSLTTLDSSTRFLENLHTTPGSGCSSSSTGLSDRNEFYRQLTRLGEDHDIAILGTSRCLPTVNGRTSRGSGSSLWEKMVSHRVSLHHVAEGSQEDQAGYDFVATLGINDKQGDGCIFPYSVVPGGIAC
jgi:hypothetical protein